MGSGICFAVLLCTNRASESLVLCSGHVIIGPVDHSCFFLIDGAISFPVWDGSHKMAFCIWQKLRGIVQENI